MAKKVFKQALANLQEAFELVKDKKNWIQDDFEEYEYDEDGDPVGEPVRFCAIGAVQYVDGRGEARAIDLLDQAREELFPKFAHIPDLNDTGSRAAAHKRVVKIFQRAIQLAKGAPAVA